MPSTNSNIKIITPTSDFAEEICDVITESITQICAIDYHNAPQIMKEWLANKTPENVVQWIISKSNRSYAALDLTTNKVIGFILMNKSG